MKFVLYKHFYENGLPNILYVKGVCNGKPQYSKYADDAKRYSLLFAMLFSFWLSLSWINARYIKS
ncbi:MAG: hypothetical protein KIT80_00220 [Chitinophagaceae bacterium]|nr:hypothetical protein [Chitinophagaceae bacterium]MCW5925315.1 hypothetical protein [Chitinophagaceae bacterium]